MTEPKEALVDPRVEWLKYRFVVLESDQHDYSGVPDVEHQLAGFDCVLASDTLTATPLTDFVSPEGARNQLEPWLRSWEMEQEIFKNVRGEFRFVQAFVKDPPGAPVRISASRSMTSSGSVSATLLHSTFPEPPKQLLSAIGISKSP